MDRLQMMGAEGASMVEYAFLLPAIALVASIAFSFFAASISELFRRPLPSFRP